MIEARLRPRPRERAAIAYLRRRSMYAFAYHSPSSLAQAQSLLQSADDAKLLAGGQTLLPTMKQRLAAPTNLIDLDKIPGLAEITSDAQGVTIGAMARHADVATSSVVSGAIPALAALAGLIGDPAVRHRGTIGGSIANNDPAADYPAACLALGATITTNKRKIEADRFFTGLFETALEEGEIITAVTFPKADKAAYQKFRNPASRYAIVGVFVAKKGADVRVAVTGAGSNGVFRATAIETALKANFDQRALDGLRVDAADLSSDIHADADYRAHLIGVLAKRAVAAAS
jgi:aerobic carbon-monoxide dehydrogenase medium subunit